MLQMISLEDHGCIIVTNYYFGEFSQYQSKTEATAVVYGC